jgi:hypothetical protein
MGVNCVEQMPHSRPLVLGARLLCMMLAPVKYRERQKKMFLILLNKMFQLMKVIGDNMFFRESRLG